MPHTTVAMLSVLKLFEGFPVTEKRDKRGEERDHPRETTANLAVPEGREWIDLVVLGA